MLTVKSNAETRGRPKKQQTRTLSPVYKQMFSDNSAIIHSSFLIYVFEVFVDTKIQKRVGHKDGGFTLYDKISDEYCFDNLEQCLKDWKCDYLLSQQGMHDFVKLLPALGPKIILREICKLINFIMKNLQKNSQNKTVQELIQYSSQQRLNEQYPYMRFVSKALKQLKIDKSDRSDKIQLVKTRVDQLWEPLIRILVYTVQNCLQGKNTNKYFKPFFSDAQNPADTYIGQLNLNQVVDFVNKQENQGKSICELKIQDESLDKLKKVRSVNDNQGTRPIFQIVRPPGAENVNKNDRKYTENAIRFDSPVKPERLQSEPVIKVDEFAINIQRDESRDSFSHQSHQEDQNSSEKQQNQQKQDKLKLKVQEIDENSIVNQAQNNVHQQSEINEFANVSKQN